MESSIANVLKTHISGPNLYSSAISATLLLCDFWQNDLTSLSLHFYILKWE